MNSAEQRLAPHQRLARLEQARAGRRPGRGLQYQYLPSGRERFRAVTQPDSVADGDPAELRLKLGAVGVMLRTLPQASGHPVARLLRRRQIIAKAADLAEQLARAERRG